MGNYIPAPHKTDREHLTEEFLEPVFYENEGGPTVGVTLLGVVQEDGRSFRDLNNDGKLDPFEDWRLSAEDRAVALVKAMTDRQLTHQLVNVMVYNPKSMNAADVLDENGKPVWSKVYPATGGIGYLFSGGDPNATNIKYLDASGMRTFVLRSDPDVEVAVWFHNGLEQYSEFDAMARGEVAVPFLTFTNPISHGLPNAQGIAAAALGDGSAGLVLEDARMDRTVMWAKGIGGLYGPQIDLATDPRWSRNATTYGEREDMAAEIARNLVIGYQGGDQGVAEGGVLVTVKHFPGDGAVYNGLESHGQAGRWRVYATENALADYQLKPFIAAFEAGAAGVMPGYSQPAADARTAPQSITYNGKTWDIRLGGYGNAFNGDVLGHLLREVLGFDGLINADSLLMDTHHGAEALTSYERMVLFVKAGCDCGVIGFADADPAALLEEALSKGDLTRADLERCAYHRLLPQIRSGSLDNPYRDLEESMAAVSEVRPKMEALAEEIHRKSVVLLKNSGGVLPLRDTGKKIYIAGFDARDNADMGGIVKALTGLGYTVVSNYYDADVAYLRVTPTIVGLGSGTLAVLDLGEDIQTPVFGGDAKPTGETVAVTTVEGMDRLRKIAGAVHAVGGKVIGEIDASNPWILTNLEPWCDALIGTFRTTDKAIADVLSGKYAPTGKLPMTMAADASVIALVTTDLDGEKWEVCVSPNDVPGYVKDRYMDQNILDASPSDSYAYRDAEGNFYVSRFGLSY